MPLIALINTDKKANNMHVVEDQETYYLNKNKYPLYDETYKVIGLAMEVQRILGRGFLEIVYKDALEIEFTVNNIFFEREKPYPIEYKGRFLNRKYNADFVLYEKLILEIKAQSGIYNEDIKQTINYLACSKLQLGLILNFGEDSLNFRRVILS